MEISTVRISDSQRLKLEEVSEQLGISFSDVFRAALKIGMDEIMVNTAQDKERGFEFVGINALKAKQ